MKELADKYPEVPWLDRNNNLVWHEGQKKEIVEPAIEDFTQPLPSAMEPSSSAEVASAD